MSKIQVLVVDDSKISYLKINDALKKTNFEICGCAKTGFEALEQYKALKPDIVTMDMHLPDMNGIDCSKEILRSAPDAKIVMISAMHDEKLISQGKNGGIEFFLQKPFNDEELIITLEMLYSKETIIPDSIKDVYIQPIIKMFGESLQLLAGVENKIEFNQISDQLLEIDGIASVVSLSGAPLKKMTLYADFKTSNNFARKVLKIIDGNELSESDVVDSIEELSSIIAGRICSYINNSIKDQEVRIAPLGTIYGKKIKMVNSKLDSFHIKAVNNLGIFNLDVAAIGGD